MGRREEVAHLYCPHVLPIGAIPQAVVQHLNMDIDDAQLITLYITYY